MGFSSSTRVSLFLSFGYDYFSSLFLGAFLLAL